ncbi:hypothetical protein [Sphingomonas baiyangensis]|uniref:Uncharacterized protein n=1 Tax=Sphingomonas baiyangensis TaxID=2572576 RepID=A0A4U1L157_9SPHN|nr:hypothetical protein [Sphingomonas baiyangensis]TKD50547.1 hypothetical protein FBR43_07060 [Sphingomonas baiyangensis]
MASEPLNGVAMTPFDQLRATVREGYTTSLDALLDTVVSQFLMANDQRIALLDAVQFTVFVAAIKSAELAGIDAADRGAMARHLADMQRAIERDVPRMVNEFVDAVKAGGGQ